MAQDIIPFSLIKADPLQAAPVLENSDSRQKLDRHFLAECLMKSVLPRTTSLPTSEANFPANPTSVANFPSNLKSVASLPANPQQKMKKYVCDVCHKSFHTFQALGGHKSIHNTNNKRIRAEPTTHIVEKPNKRPRCLNLFQTPTSSSSDTETELMLAEDREEGEIASCSKAPFSTLQALGGHKSSHFYNKNRTNDQTNQTTHNFNSHKRPTLLQLFPETPGMGFETERSSSPAHLEQPTDVALEIILGL